LKISFRPLGGPEVVEGLRLQAGGHDQLGRRARVGRRPTPRGPDPGRRVEDVLDVRVVVSGPAHERDGGEELPVAVPCNDRVGADPVLHCHHGRRRPEPREAGCDRLDVGPFARDDHELRFR